MAAYETLYINWFYDDVFWVCSCSTMFLGFVAMLFRMLFRLILIQYNIWHHVTQPFSLSIFLFQLISTTLYIHCSNDHISQNCLCFAVYLWPWYHANLSYLKNILMTLIILQSPYIRMFGWMHCSMQLCCADWITFSGFVFASVCWQWLKI